MQSRCLIFIFFIIFGVLCSEVSAQNRIDGTFGKGLSVLAKDSSFLVKFGFRFQTLYSGRTMTNSDVWTEQMMIRRSRLKFDGFAFSPKVVYKVELGVSNRDTRGGRFEEGGNTASIILDAVVKWQFAPGWSLWAGQTKLPGNRERVISSQKLQFVDRSLVNSRFTLDRDIGLQLRHSGKVGGMVLRQALAISTGEGRDIITPNLFEGRQYTARAEFLPFGSFTSKGDYFGSDLKREPTPKLSIGVTGDFNNKTYRSRGNLGNFLTDSLDNPLRSDLLTLQLDGIFKYRGWSVATEYAYRTAPEKVAGFGYGSGITVSSGYLLPGNVELAVRYTAIDPISNESSIGEADEYMLGVSKYIKGHNLKVQSDVSHTEVPGAGDFFMLRAQFELAF